MSEFYPCTDHLTTLEAAACADCGWHGTVSDVAAVKDAELRLEAGGETPAGECPDCGALAYLDRHAGAAFAEIPAPSTHLGSGYVSTIRLHDAAGNVDGFQFIGGETYRDAHLNARLWAHLAGYAVRTRVVLACDADH